MSESIQATIRASIALLGIAETTPIDARLTLGRVLQSAQSAPIAPGLPTLSLADLADVGSQTGFDLVATAELGRGGMGVVHLARQHSLGRDVAVKTAHVGSFESAAVLVREGRVMGGLEHPNVVPVHALGQGSDGVPLLVMKRVEGVSWSQLLREPEHTLWSSLLIGHGDRLRVHVEILGQVARALSFAHSRGVIHRDIKPDNVMIGAFGEVYVLDWGIAIKLDERANEAQRIVGTPGYLAPEMAMGDAKLMDARTDVYLLGAVLYEVLTQRMPHESGTMMGALSSSLLGEIAPIENAPRGLAAVATHALSLRKEDRPDSAEVFRQGLLRFLASREALALVVAAERAMKEAEGDADAHDATAPAVGRLLLDAHFALRTARSMLQNDEDVERAYRLCVNRLVSRELALRSPGGARSYLAEFEDADPSVLAKIEELESALATEQSAAREQQQAVAEADVSAMLPIARFGLLVAGFVTITLTLWSFRGSETQSPQGVILQSPQWVIVQELLVYGLVGTFVPFSHRQLLATAASRRVFGFLLLWYSYPLPLAFIAIFRHQSVFDWATALVAGMLLAAAGAATILPGLWPSVGIHAIATVATTALPHHFDKIFSAMLLLNLVIVFRAIQQQRKSDATLFYSSPNRHSKKVE